MQTRTFAVKGGTKAGAKTAKGGVDKNKEKQKKKKKKKVGQAGEATRKGPTIHMEMGVLEAALEKQLSQTPAEDSRSAATLALDRAYALEYNRRMRAAHVAQQKAQVEFLRQRWMAINALPTALRNEALKEDMTPWPENYMPIPWTPQEYVERFNKEYATQQQQQKQTEESK